MTDKDDVFERARRAKEQAASVAAGLKDSARDKLDGARDLLASGAADLMDASLARIKETLADLSATLPALKEAGYTLTDVSVSIGVPPRIVGAFHAADDVSVEAATKVIDANADRKLTVFLIRALLQARKLQTSVEIAGMKPRGISVEIGLAPSVVVKFA